uniref:BAH domain-containing protein n=1 Tax=Setaria digitata TaxID=48799 RepID=A0A915PQE6_9BILA
MASAKFVRYRPVVPVVDQKPVEGSYCWDEFLEKLLIKLDRSGSVNSRCPTDVVPVECFYQAPFAEYMKYIDTSVKIEVALFGDYDCNSEPIKLYWFARVMKVAGYRLLLRYEGMDEVGDNAYDFWVSIGSSDIRPVGYCAEKAETRALVPPEAIHKRQSNWPQYILCQIHAYRTIAINWPEIQIRKMSLSSYPFREGDYVELLDSTVSLRVRPARVEKVIGTRIWVRVSQVFLNQSANDRGGDSQINEGVWMDQDSPLIFPVGWALNVGYVLGANDEYIKYAKEISNELKSKSPNISHGKDGPEKTFIPREAKDVHITWEKGMKLEVLDPLDAWKELRVSTVIEVMDDGFLRIGFDGEEMEDDSVPIHSTSELLFPVGYAKKYGIKLKQPKNIEFFDWNAYLRQCNAVAAPEELFNVFTDDALSNFKIGAKLEATDMCEPHLICPATVAAHHGRLLRIQYDGWDSSYDQLFDYRCSVIISLTGPIDFRGKDFLFCRKCKSSAHVDCVSALCAHRPSQPGTTEPSREKRKLLFRSSNIFPLGWCEMHGYKLEAPKISYVSKKKRRKE